MIWKICSKNVKKFTEKEIVKLLTNSLLVKNVHMAIRETILLDALEIVVLKRSLNSKLITDA